MTDPQPYEVVAVELSSFQLYWSSTIGAQAGRAAQHRRASPGLARHLRRVRGPTAKIFTPRATAIGNLDDEWLAH